MSDINFNDRVAIVTGAGAGMGRQYAIELAKRGAKVVVNDLGGARDGSGQSTSAADKVVEEIKAFGGEAVANYNNVALAEGGENIVKEAVDKFGKVDILINNAGNVRDKTFNKMDEPSWDAVMNVHLKGAFCVTRPAYLNMRENKYGRIVMTTSSSGTYGNFGQSNYAAAKLGLLGLANVLKLEGEKYNIRTNLIAPTAATRFTEDIFPPDLFEKMKPEFVTPAVLYLCSQDCTDSA
jgi:NAD(P)-dependent dehydrogenase (short-subunit alcohol dehydrogenase family)